MKELLSKILFIVFFLLIGTKLIFANANNTFKVEPSKSNLNHATNYKLSTQHFQPIELKIIQYLQDFESLDSEEEEEEDKSNCYTVFSKYYNANAEFLDYYNTSKCKVIYHYSSLSNSNWYLRFSRYIGFV
jgi:hypothetical protein